MLLKKTNPTCINEISINYISQKVCYQRYYVDPRLRSIKFNLLASSVVDKVDNMLRRRICMLFTLLCFNKRATQDLAAVNSAILDIAAFVVDIDAES